ncbi:hypothetical protein AQUCO_01000380v1 [Aquilegia coerulea]|uniref:Uncharacterized protein n=1 Tax=Aquilegia coerulea TaxID=218851 RepID=A0A2G5E9Q2_AQUCA|nr:hypothetical protein AQUCO_01000380v1 [Aquilegia coerulea]
MASDNLDRLSNSPKEVIDAILARMPVRDAVKTSFLSKGWRYRWMSMPVLVIKRERGSGYPIAFVNKLLLLHEGIVSKFELDDFLKTSSDVNHWILVLSRKTVNDLKLNFQPNDNYQVPSCLFCCQSLRKLELGGCLLKLPSDYRGFCGLTQLILSYVTLTNETFHSLLLKIPLLQTLLINYCKSLTHFNIHALNLKEFTVEGDCESFNFQNAPNVKVAKIKVSLPGFPVRFKLDDDLQGLDRVESLTLFNPFVEFLPTDIAQERLDITYSHLTDVCLHVNFEDVKQILAVLCLCRSAPRLETFKINVK